MRTPAGTSESLRRSVVPSAAGRSVWLAAVWTGAGTAVVAATVAIAGVAICWLPASHGSGNAMSALRAGLLTFLAAVHGGITVDGTSAAFLPLGLTVLLGAIAWQAGRALAEAAAELGEADPTRLLLSAAAQAGSFTVACLVCVPLATLGTSSVPFLGVAGCSLLLFALAGGTAFVRASPLADAVRERTPPWLWPGARAGLGGLLVLVGAGAVLVACSLAVHHGRVEQLTAQVGPGWNAAPVLLLCILAAPNAVIAGAAYLAGPGFAVGSGTTVAAGASTHGVLPAFPVLAALPSGPSPGWMWWPVVLVPLGASVYAGRSALREDGWPARLRACAVGAAIAAVGGAVLGWQAGGGIGDGRLHVIGASPWQFGLAVGAELLVGSVVTLGVAAGWAGVRAFVGTVREGDGAALPWRPPATDDAVTERIGELWQRLLRADTDAAEGDELAG